MGGKKKAYLANEIVQMVPLNHFEEFSLSKLALQCRNRLVGFVPRCVKKKNLWPIRLFKFGAYNLFEELP